MIPASAPSERLHAVDLAEVVARFADLLHRSGVPATPERAGRFARAVTLARPATVDELYWCARVTLVTEQAQLKVFDAVFAQVFRGLVDLADSRGQAGDPTITPAVRAGAPKRVPGPSAMVEASGDSARAGDQPSRDEAAEDVEGPVATAPVSERELLRRRDFGSCTPEELERIRALLAELPLVPPERPSRRTERHRGGPVVDLRRTVAAARRSGGDPARLERRRARTRPRRVVLLADVSGSMEPYARAYLTVLHGAVRGVHAEAFVFATRLTRLTRQLALTDPQVALTKAMAEAEDWAGGTRIGAAIKAFNDGWGRRGLARGAVVVVVSDGWESGEPALLGRELERLSRLAHRIVWVNPRKQNAAYRPLVGGMAAALPHVDTFVSGHSVDAVTELLSAIAASGGVRR